jgi:hypothetical protein
MQRFSGHLFGGIIYLFGALYYDEQIACSDACIRPFLEQRLESALMLSQGGESLAMAALGLAAGVIFTIVVVPAPQKPLATPVMAAVSPAGSSPTLAVVPPSSEATEAGIDRPATRITEAHVKRDVRRALKGPARFGKLYQGNGTSGRFSICGDVMTTRNVVIPFLYLADTREVMMFTTPANPRVTVEVYNIFMMDCRGDDRLAGK